MFDNRDKIIKVFYDNRDSLLRDSLKISGIVNYDNIKVEECVDDSLEKVLKSRIKETHDDLRWQQIVRYFKLVIKSSLFKHGIKVNDRLRKEANERHKIFHRKYYKINKDKIKAKNLKWRANNKERWRKYVSTYWKIKRIENGDEVRAKERIYYAKNKDKINARKKKYHCGKCYYGEYRKSYYEKNKERIKEWKKKWYERNKERLREKHRQYHIQRKRLKLMQSQ